MKFLEKDLETIIFEADGESLSERGLPIYGNKLRQVYIGGYGIADIITYYREGTDIYITVYELKKGIINCDTMIQSLRYVKGINRYFEERGVSFNYHIKCILVGDSVDSSDWVYMANSAYNLDGRPLFSLYTYDYGFDGITFKEDSGYKLIDEKFNLPKNNDNGETTTK